MELSKQSGVDRAKYRHPPCGGYRGPDAPTGALSGGIHPQKIFSCVASRIVVHMKNGTVVCGFLDEIAPNGCLLVTEALQGHSAGPKLLIREVEITSDRWDYVCHYDNCGLRLCFPLDACSLK